MLRKPFNFAMAAACGGLVFTGTAQADRVLDLIRYAPLVNDVSDDNAEFLIDRSENGNLDVGDSIRGVVNFHTINTAGANLGGLTGNSEFSGIFQIQVTGKIDNGDGSFTFTFGPDDEFDVADQVLGGNGNVNNAMVLLWDDTTPDFAIDNSVAEGEATATNGDFFWAVGFNDPDSAARVEDGAVVSDNGEGWVATGAEAFTAAAGVNPASFIGGANFAANLVSDAGLAGDLPLLDQQLSGLLLSLFGADAGAMAQFIGNSTVHGAEGELLAAGWDASSQTEFSFVVIPTPAAFGPGLVLMGMLIARRRRQTA